MDGWFAALEASALAAFMRDSLWAYPLVNTLHIVGIALLFGAIAALDLRLIGAWRSVPAAPLARVLVPVAGAGLVLSILAGFLLFTVRASEYAASALFQAKMALILAAIANAGLLRFSSVWRGDGAAAPASGRAWLRGAGLASLLLWLAAIAAGRLLGYR